MKLRKISSFGWVWITLLAPAHGHALKPFTVAEEIHIANFFPYHDTPPITVSPNGRFVAIRTERGLLDIGRVEDELRVYDRAELKEFMQGNARRSPAPEPVLDVRESTYKQGPLIRQIRWLRNSSALVFLLRDGNGLNELMTVGLKEKMPHLLSLKGQNVTAFAVRDRTHYAYTVFNPGAALRSPWRDGRVAWDATGRSIWEVLIPLAWNARIAHLPGPPGSAPLRSVLWVATSKRPHLLLQQNGKPVLMYPWPGSLALAPRGDVIAAEIPVRRVPKSWAREFLPAPNQSLVRISPGDQDLSGAADFSIVNEYALIDLRSGSVSAVNGAPTGSGGGWYSDGGLVWSQDGSALLLPNTYTQPRKAGSSDAQPCLAVFYRETHSTQCVQRLQTLFSQQAQLGAGVTEIRSAGFANQGNDKVIVRYVRYRENAEKEGAVVFSRADGGLWEVSGGRTAQKDDAWPEVSIAQGLNTPPVVVATYPRTGQSRVIWNPNPQLAGIAIGKVSVYHWKDPLGHHWIGGLYKPAHYLAGSRYPLVIQAHGFPKNRFSSSGIYPTAMAARALGASGMYVLQLSSCVDIDTPKSGPCDVASIDAAVGKLVAAGLVDPSRIGIIGFSYTVYTTLEALTTSKVQFAAASVTDGWSYGYWEYLTQVDAGGDGYAREANAMIGAKPFGAGLLTWLKKAPDFNMQKVHTPLLINSTGRISVLDGMWEIYAPLRYLQKPVDFVILHSDEHVLTNPAVRMASQGGSVDWFRFWLQGHEDTDPKKAQRYRLWEKLCDMQRTEVPNRPAFCLGKRRQRAHSKLPD